VVLDRRGHRLRARPPRRDAARPRVRASRPPAAPRAVPRRCCRRARAGARPPELRLLGEGGARAPPGRAAPGGGPGRPRERALRSVAWFALITFVPLWEVHLGHSKAHGNHLLALMLFAGGVGTLAMGPLADRFGRRPVLLTSVVLTSPLIYVYLAVGGVPGAVALALVGACVVGTFGVTMVM